jgi:D-glycero-D-manno-heptose 1,7-bisphosphate phosphatase
MRPPPGLVRAAFLDLDGTLIEDHSGRSLRDGPIVLLPGAHEAVGLLFDAAYLPIIVTNQSAVARGKVALAEAREVVVAAVRELHQGWRSNVHDCYLCPHQVGDGCACRKPRPGMLLQAACDHPIHLPSSVMIGNDDVDLEAGERAGCGACHRVTAERPLLRIVEALLADDPHVRELPKEGGGVQRYAQWV